MSHGIVVTDVRPIPRPTCARATCFSPWCTRANTSLKSVEQFNKLLAGLDKNAVITLQVRRGESTAFVTISGLTDKG